jgi:hypothetical protein
VVVLLAGWYFSLPHYQQISWPPARVLTCKLQIALIYSKADALWQPALSSTVRTLRSSEARAVPSHVQSRAEPQELDTAAPTASKPGCISGYCHVALNERCKTDRCVVVSPQNLTSSKPPGNLFVNQADGAWLLSTECYGFEGKPLSPLWLLACARQLLHRCCCCC